MIKNYLKVAFRNLQRNRKHAILNILGLSVALAACIIVFLVIQFETSYDKHLGNFRNIYQVVTKNVDGDGESFSSGVPFPATKHLRKDFPQYTFAELMQFYDTQITAKNADGSGVADKKFYESTGIFYGDPELLKIFEIKFIRGNAETLTDPGSVVISQSSAERYFGSAEGAIGRRINFNNEPRDLQVSGVFEDVPVNSDFPFHVVASYAGFEKHGEGWPLDDWGSNTSNHQVYTLLPNAANAAVFDQQLTDYEAKYRKSTVSKRTHFLEPLAKMHFDERLSVNGDHITSKPSLYTLSFIALLIILMACINFVNLSTALAVTRGKEVGIRKVMGGSKHQLRFQVFAETALIVCISALVAIGLVYLTLPFIKNIMVVQTRLDLFNAGSILFIIIVTGVTIIFSGLYPAFVIGRFKPVEAIKNKINTTKVGSVPLRRVLVVLQFAFSQVFIIATIIAISQMRFIRNANLGFNKEAIITVSVNGDSASIARRKAFRDELLARSDVKQVSFSVDAPSSDNTWESNFAFDEMKDRDFGTNLKYADENYAATYGLELVAGKFYTESDTARELVVNETFLKRTGGMSPQAAIGKLLRIGGSKPKPVIGVVKDFKLHSLREPVAPTVISPRSIYYGTVGIKLSGKNLALTNAEIEKIWNKYYPEYVYNSTFLDDNIREFYVQEERLSRMYKVYAFLAILISCLGLYGLVSFMVVQKTKEVGIRKVLGASVSSIVYLFSKEFTLLIAIAFVLAAPAAWYLMNTWLQDFEYRIPIGIGFFAIAIVVSVAIAWLTVGYKAVRAGLANPVKSLRTE